MISHVSLHSFRSHPNMSVSFSPKTNVIIGANGSGKTNILEAILMLSHGKSFRSPDVAVIRHQETASKVRLEVSGRERVMELRLQPNGQTDKTFVVDNKQFKRLSFHKTLPVVLFEPNFMSIIARGPDTRREYVDTLLSRIEPDYQRTLNAYRRTLVQRNSLLKQLHPTSDQLFVWDLTLAELAGKLVGKRLELIEKLNASLGEMYSKIAGVPHEIAVTYVTSLNTADYTSNLIKGLQANVKKDRDYGFTSLGPHRDDFHFFINRQPAVNTASRGENRTLLLALKIMEAELVEQARGHKPLLLLDDVFSELDEIRQAKLVEYFVDNQVIITSTTITPLLKGVSGEIIEL
jgi:DNA replication and repair protein RecF